MSWRTWIRQTEGRVGWYSSVWHKPSDVPQDKALVTFDKGKDGQVNRVNEKLEPTPEELEKIELYEKRHEL